MTENKRVYELIDIVEPLTDNQKKVLKGYVLSHDGEGKAELQFKDPEFLAMMDSVGLVQYLPYTNNLKEYRRRIGK